jgi:hypothetical protein
MSDDPVVPSAGPTPRARERGDGARSRDAETCFGLPTFIQGAAGGSRWLSERHSALDLNRIGRGPKGRDLGGGAYDTTVPGESGLPPYRAGVPHRCTTPVSHPQAQHRLRTQAGGPEKPRPLIPF